MTQNARKMMKTLKSIRKQNQKQDRKKQRIMKKKRTKNDGSTVKNITNKRDRKKRRRVKKNEEKNTTKLQLKKSHARKAARGKEGHGRGRRPDRLLGSSPSSLRARRTSSGLTRDKQLLRNEHSYLQINGRGVKEEIRDEKRYFTYSSIYLFVYFTTASERRRLMYSTRLVLRGSGYKNGRKTPDWCSARAWGSKQDGGVPTQEDDTTLS